MFNAIIVCRRSAEGGFFLLLRFCRNYKLFFGYPRVFLRLCRVTKYRNAQIIMYILFGGFVQFLSKKKKKKGYLLVQKFISTHPHPYTLVFFTNTQVATCRGGDCVGSGFFPSFPFLLLRCRSHSGSVSNDDAFPFQQSSLSHASFARNGETLTFPVLLKRLLNSFLCQQDRGYTKQSKCRKRRMKRR